MNFVHPSSNVDSRHIHLQDTCMLLAKLYVQLNPDLPFTYFSLPFKPIDEAYVLLCENIFGDGVFSIFIVYHVLFSEEYLKRIML